MVVTSSPALLRAADRVVVLQSGRIVETAPAARLFDDPQHEYTRMLLGSTLEDTPPRQALTPADLRAEVESFLKQGAALPASALAAGAQFRVDF